MTIGIVLIVLFGTVQLGILGFTQAAGDGAAFVAAHTYAQNPARGATYAAATATGVFDKIPASAITVTPQAGTVTASTATTAAGISVPGAPAVVTLQSSATERVPSAPGSSPVPFAVAGTLQNYRNASGLANSAHPLVPAQTFGTGHGANGRFAEWFCRDGVYSGISFPASRPTGAATGPNTFWDPAWHASPLARIYAWERRNDMRLSAEARRGQTLPLWTLSIAATLTVLFFVTNYANTVRWGIRAQNAADSAASAGIATDANVHNQVTTLEFAATVEETRMRYLIQAISNTVNNPSGCGSGCNAYYTSLVGAYRSASAGYSTIAHAMQTGDNLTEGGLQNSPDKAIGLLAGDCTLSDCAFTYTTTITSSAETVDVVTCKKVPFLSPALFGLAPTATFTALGRSVESVEPLAEAFVPGSLNPKTGQPFQPDESPAGANVPPDYVVTFKNVTVEHDLVHRGARAAGAGRARIRVFLMHAQRGQAMLETILFLPVALVVLFAILYFARFGVLEERAQSAVRYAALMSYESKTDYGAANIYDAVAPNRPAPSACSATVVTDTVNALDGKGPSGSAQPFWKPDHPATATCSRFDGELRRRRRGRRITT